MSKYPRWEKGYRRHALYLDETTAISGVGIAPPPNLAPRPPGFKPYSWRLYTDGGFTSSDPKGDCMTLKQAEREAWKAAKSAGLI